MLEGTVHREEEGRRRVDVYPLDSQGAMMAGGGGGEREEGPSLY